MKVDLSEVNVVEICAHTMRVTLRKVPKGKELWEGEDIVVFNRIEDGRLNHDTLGLGCYHVELQKE